MDLKTLISLAILARSFTAVKQDKVPDPVIVAGTSSSWESTFAKYDNVLRVLEFHGAIPLPSNQISLIGQIKSAVEYQPFVSFSEAELTGPDLVNSMADHSTAVDALILRCDALLNSSSEQQ